MTPSRKASGLGLIFMSVFMPVLAQENPQHPDWPPQTDELVEAWKAHHDDIETLRDMVLEAKFIAVVLMGDFFDVRADDYSQVATDDLEDSDRWTKLMKRSNVTGIAHVDGILAFVVKPPKTTNDRSEAVNYVYSHPLQAIQCAEEFREISCGICDVPLDHDWSIRYTWTSGEFEEEYSENFIKVYQDKDSNLSIDEVRSRYDESERACMRSGLEEMGYENPEDFYSSDR